MRLEQIAVREEVVNGANVTVRVIASRERKQSEEPVMHTRDDSRKSGQRYMQSENRRFGMSRTQRAKANRRMR